MRRALALLAACSGHHAAAPEIDAPPPPACTATYTGNVTEIATTDAPCTALAGTMFTASIPSHALDAPLAVAIDLGTTASAGVFASATVPAWSADGVRTAAHEPCTYSGGSAVSPHGDFTLSLDGAHGTLTAHTYVLAAAFTDCGDPDTQTVVLAF